MKSWARKLASCKSNIPKAIADNRSEWVYLTSWNISVVFDYNPIDCTWWAKKDAPKDHVDQVLNEKVLGLGTVDTLKRVGVVTFDSCELFVDQIFDVVRSNRGCGGLVRQIQMVKSFQFQKSDATKELLQCLLYQLVFGDS